MLLAACAGLMLAIVVGLTVAPSSSAQASGGLATVIFEVESDDPAAFVNIDDPARGRTFVATVDTAAGVRNEATDLLFELLKTPYLVFAGGCDDPDVSFVDSGLITVGQPMLTGIPADGARITCTLIAEPPPPVEISLTLVGPGGIYQIATRVGRTESESESIFRNQAAGETLTLEGVAGGYFEVEVFFPFGFDYPSWQRIETRCSGDNGNLGHSESVLSQGFSGILPFQELPYAIDCQFVMRDATYGEGATPVVTCLAGNGRIDLNIVNTDFVPHEYQVQIGSLSPRTRTVDGQDWWRSPVTGRPDGRIAATVLRDGEVILDRELIVACDNDPQVSTPEVRVLKACRGGNGFVAWQFANPTDQSRSYIIEFDGAPNRSTTAAPHGATIRGVSGRQDGTYRYTIKASGVVVRRGGVTVFCDGPVGGTAS